MKIRAIQCKTLLTKSRLPEVAFCINPYIGCSHACVYCYSRFMKRFTGHLEKWGEFVDVKTNAPEVLERELARKTSKGTALLGSVTDAYQPIERRYGLTRRILMVLLKHDFPVSILTKSSLVTRDIDLLKQFSNCEAGLTITTLKEEVAKDFEPYSSSPQERLKALEMLHQAGITTYGFIGPILPGLTDIRQIFTALQGKVDFIMAESLNLKCGNWQDIQGLIGKKYPHLLSIYKAELDKGYWDRKEREIRNLSKEFNISPRGFYRH